MGFCRLSAKKLLLAAAIMLLLGAMSAGCSSKKDAAATAEDFIGLYTAGDFESAFNYLSPTSYEKQQGWDADYFREKSESAYGGPYELVDLNFKPEGREGDEVSFNIMGTVKPLDGGDYMTLGGEIKLVGEDGAWLVSYIDWVAVPESIAPF
jgi:hypothetical protein